MSGELGQMTRARHPYERARAIAAFTAGGESFRHVDLAALGGMFGDLSGLPYCLRVVLENLVRNQGELGVETDQIAHVANWAPDGAPLSLPLRVSRVILPDSSGLPALMDLAALRGALVGRGVAAEAVGPQIPVDLVIDHSLIVESAGSAASEAHNVAREFERNAERYSFFKWAQQAFDGLRVVPPGMGIVHQVHIERLANVVAEETRDGQRFAFPEFVLGGDSHTPMVNALGILAWGVGGIEAEAALLGQPHMVRIGQVIGVRLTGERLREGVTTTDLVLTVTQRLREVGVVGQFVEFTGPGLDRLTVPERATLANMAPEYGATVGYFPIDAMTIAYLRQTGRDAAHVALVESYAKAAGLFRDGRGPEPRYSKLVEIDLAAIEPSVAGPRRPQDRMPLSAVKPGFRELLRRPFAEGGYAAEDADRRVTVEMAGERVELSHGSLAIAAITSCTNTSNPWVMLGAGLLARRAVERGLRPSPAVKASLAPGSRVVTGYLQQAGLLPCLEQLGFYVVGYGCTTCSGKSGALAEPVARAIEDEGLVAAAVVSGNRNFEGRIHRLVRANYIASPMLVVAYALAGRIDIDFSVEPIGHDPQGSPVYLRDIWPANAEIAALVGMTQEPRLYDENYAALFDGTALWESLAAQSGPLFQWPTDSTYIHEPPFFRHLGGAAAGIPDMLRDARALCIFGDSLTTDHISPAGEIPLDSPAGRYLQGQGVAQQSFNAFTQRRGNHEVMVRGAFANIRIRNLLVPDTEGGVTLQFPAGVKSSVHDAAMVYAKAGTPVIVIAGKDYGMGSSRDWAAKGPALLGVRAVLAESYERIHRANLVGMGILPLCFRAGENRQSLGLTGAESYTFSGIAAALSEGAPIAVTAAGEDGRSVSFAVELAVESRTEVSCLQSGGIFATIFNQILQKHAPDLREPHGGGQVTP